MRGALDPPTAHTHPMTMCGCACARGALDPPTVHTHPREAGRASGSRNCSTSAHRMAAAEDGARPRDPGRAPRTTVMQSCRPSASATDATTYTGGEGPGGRHRVRDCLWSALALAVVWGDWGSEPR